MAVRGNRMVVYYRTVVSKELAVNDEDHARRLTRQILDNGYQGTDKDGIETYIPRWNIEKVDFYIEEKKQGGRVGWRSWK